MPKVLAFVAAWFLAAAIALVVAWQGVAIVTEQVTEPRPAPLSAGEIRQEQDVVVNEPPTTATAPTSTTVPTSIPTATTVRQSSPTTSSPTTTPTTVATTAPPASTINRTYILTGGSASLRFSPSGVTVAWANPNAGFDVKVEPENGNGAKVEFESDSHRSRVDGWWADGPQDRVREEDR